MNQLKMQRKGAITLYIIIGMIILVVLGILLYYNNLYYEEQKLRQSVFIEKPSVFLEEFPAAEEFSSGFICENEVTSDCFICGCPEGYTCNGAKCELINNTQPRPFIVLFVPMNYRPTDPDFLDRVGKAIDFIKEQTAIPDESFLIIDKTLKTNRTCDFEVSELAIFADEWHKQNFGLSLPAPYVENGKYIYNHRVIGINKQEQEISECGCGFTYLMGDSVYLGGNECGKLSHIVAHEFGHTFGLCDEYDTCVWDDTNAQMKCVNTKPDKYNSNCGDVCCNQDVACCFGKYSVHGFNMMGSANMPPEREINFESKTVINSFVCKHFGVC
ncbi:hypothetical protein KY325_04000 [Candidatus Woesearchaeota archaeon]|nr:hypothetical protein [Candidatus Woesearchaeota archaeon]MBW3018297.1 hypothetical protein [Candidatus Woesearchaeota archaeon]